MKEFDKVIGYKNVKAELFRLCDLVKNKEKYETLGVTVPKGLLLYGNPGLGKTLLCNCFIEASGRKAFICRKDKPDGDFVNEIKTKFDEAAKNEPSIVYLDDLDKFSNDGYDNRNSEEFVTIQSCIDANKDKDIYVIATVNDMRLLPRSLTRAGRFDNIIELKAPKGEDAVEIVKYYLSKKKYVGELDARGIARILDGSSCAQLETVINEAGIRAGYSGKNVIEMDDIIKACMRVIYKAPECLENGNEKFLRNIAYHEAGHSVIAEVLEPESVNIISVLKNESDIGGVTSYHQDDDYFQSIDYMENRVISLLGGKAATEIVYGKIDVGTISDMRRAYDIVERFVDYYCGYGFNAFERPDGNSDHKMEIKDQKIAQELERYYQKAKSILIENRELLDKMAEKLVEKKVITYIDIAEIKKNIKVA